MYTLLIMCSCSVACCKIHKESCSSGSESLSSTVVTANGTGTVTAAETEVAQSSNSNTSLSPSTNSLQSKLKSSTRLQDFLTSNPYLLTQLPVLLARIDRQSQEQNPVATPSEMAKELERKERINCVLGEAVDTDPIVAELYKILQEEDLI